MRILSPERGLSATYKPYRDGPADRLEYHNHTPDNKRPGEVSSHLNMENPDND